MHPKSIDQFKSFQIGSCEFDLIVGRHLRVKSEFPVTSILIVAVYLHMMDHLVTAIN